MFGPGIFWSGFESLRFACPAFADELVRREAFEGFQPSTEIVSVDEISEMASQLVVAVVVIAFDGGFLDNAVHSLDLTIGPRMIDFGEAMRDAVLAASHVEHVCHVAGGWAIGVAWRETELDAVAPTEAREGAAETRVRAAFHCKRAPVEVAMASQGFSRM